MAYHQVKQGDTEPLRLQLRDRRGAVDLTVGVTSITFRMEAQAADHYVEVEAEIDDADGDKGWVNVPWTDEDVENAGIYRAEVVVLKSDDVTQTFPSEGEPPYLMIKINPAVVEDA